MPSDVPVVNLDGGAWCIYVGRAARGNFVIGRDAQTWGMDRAAKMDGVKKGDRLVFVERLEGYGRISREKFPGAIGKAETLVEAVITSDVYDDPTPLWPDGPYPHRFKFVETGELRDVRLVDAATPEVIEAVRLSGLKQGAAVFAQIAPRIVEGSVEPGAPDPASLDDLAESTFMDSADLREIESLLLEKKQIVLEGPPGSGKTYLADKFARYFTGNPLNGPTDDSVEIVQFHQSYGYEDFVQGIRPFTNEQGSLGYRVQPGVFMSFCARAAEEPNKRFVIVIDEINRGSISRIFGELLLLLEYRDRRVRLPYGAENDPEDQYLSIPRNVFIVGTMNSTDRSLALIDYALRRRFYFYRLLPTMNGSAPVFANWLSSQDLDDADRQRLLNLFLQLNRKVRSHLPEDFQVGHSYFMVTGIAEDEVLQRVWRRAIVPLLLEYFHNARNSAEILDGFTISALTESEPDQADAEMPAE